MSIRRTLEPSKATLGKLLRDGVERIWAFSSAQIPSSTELAETHAVTHTNVEFTFANTGDNVVKVVWHKHFQLLHPAVSKLRMGLPTPVTLEVLQSVCTAPKHKLIYGVRVI